MPVQVHLHDLENKTISLEGELPSQELDLDGADELIHLPQSLAYKLEVQRTPDGILARGSLLIDLECECVRCLKPFPCPIRLEHWVCLIPLEGEEKVAVVQDGVDLTPYIREDILLAFPQHPLCRADCQGIEKLRGDGSAQPGSRGQSGSGSASWADLDKLKF